MNKSFVTVYDRLALLGESNRFYIGVIAPEISKEFTLKLFNDTPKKLKIKNVSVSCGCIKIIDAPKIIFPGQTENLLCRWDVKGTHGEQF
jgi:hypothetical protein